MSVIRLFQQRLILPWWREKNRETYLSCPSTVVFTHVQSTKESSHPRGENSFLSSLLLPVYIHGRRCLTTEKNSISNLTLWQASCHLSGGWRWCHSDVLHYSEWLGIRLLLFLPCLSIVVLSFLSLSPINHQRMINSDFALLKWVRGSRHAEEAEW